MVNKLSQYLKAPAQLHWQACKKVLWYIRGTLCYGLLFKPSTFLQLEAYIDVHMVGEIGDKGSIIVCCVYFRQILI